MQDNKNTILIMEEKHSGRIRPQFVNLFAQWFYCAFFKPVIYIKAKFFQLFYISPYLRTFIIFILTFQFLNIL